MAARLALDDDVLMSVEKSARYIGNEINSVIKNKDEVAIRFAFCFPDVYEIGMSHLGIQILYEMFNRRDDVWCERVYSPWPDLDKKMRERNIPLFALESQDPIKDFDFLGITLQYEMCYTNILQVLELSHIPIWQRDRDNGDPITICGGPCTYNPEPIADFFDIVYIGEGETSYDALFDLYKKMQSEGSFDRKAFLHEAARIPGLYVPSLYEVSYKSDNTIAAVTPIYDDIPERIVRQVEGDLDNAPYPLKPVIPYVQATQDRVVLEIQRGCIRGCRFCQAGMIYRPNRQKSLETLKDYAVKMLDATGYDEISLSSLSSSDYDELPELLDFLIGECNKRHVNISLPSLRIDAFSLDVMSKIQDVKKSSLTFAPEAGSQRMRNVINKGLTEEVIMNGATEAFKGGWSKVKLYFMLGLPTETDEDILEIPRLSDRLAMRYYDTVPKEERHGRCMITMSTSFFVPKPFTPFQWSPMCEPEEYLRRAKLVNDEMKAQLNHKSLSYQWHHAQTTVMEGIFARGDRKVANAIYTAYKNGAVFDAWNEYFDYDRWMEAFKSVGLDPAFYYLRERPLDEILPWDHIDVNIRRSFLENEYRRAMEGVITPNCRDKCSGCGCMVLKNGICNAH